jgi:hypothetical protein
MLLGAAAVIAVLAGGYFAFTRSTASPATPSAVAAARTEPVAERVAPVAPAPVVAGQPVEAAPVVEAAPEVVATPVAEAAQTQPVAKLPAPATGITAPVEPSAAAARVTVPVEPTAASIGDAKPAAPVAVAGVEPPPSSAAAAPAATAPGATAAAPTEAATAEPAAAGAPVAVAAEAPANLPATPTREEVAAGFDALRPDLLQCAAGKTGVVIIDATLAGAGRVAYALVDGKDFKGSPEGSCMARTIRKARFPQFAQETLKVRYPVQL